MSKVTSKLQVTIPKAIAVEFGLVPGSDVVFEAAGEAIRVRLVRVEPHVPDVTWQLHLFDEATRRQEERDRIQALSGGSSKPGRDWTREELYDRGLAR